jgi:multicomponent Na+:H+ antiporter subunit E
MRVVTGHINPGIVKLEPGLKTDLAKMILADSITLTPGTLTVDVDDDGAYYIHWINVLDVSPKEEQVYGSFARWARRLAD